MGSGQCTPSFLLPISGCNAANFRLETSQRWRRNCLNVNKSVVRKCFCGQQASTPRSRPGAHPHPHSQPDLDPCRLRCKCWLINQATAVTDRQHSATLH